MLWLLLAHPLPFNFVHLVRTFASLIFCWGSCVSNYDVLPWNLMLIKAHAPHGQFLWQPRALINISFEVSSLTFDLILLHFISSELQSGCASAFSVFSVMDPTKLPEVADLSKIPAMFPPDGVESNFVNPYSNGPKLTRLSAIFLALMGLCVLIRFYTKIFIKHSWGWDDCESASRWPVSSIYLHLVGLCVPAVVRSVPLNFMAYLSLPPRLVQ